ncbi:BRCA1-A complex subunit RAP80, partial [Heterodontus francisci]|uniref:BRCA1-A complex subunit RAP80 n=1 Tax=Heterodontus francisci TaxID=7792 RepID=UPI00355BA4D3
LGEEQQLALAFMMSARDADEQSTNMEKEEELLKKAIKESLQMHSPDESRVGDELKWTVTDSNVGDTVTAVCRKSAPVDARLPERQQEVESQTPLELAEPGRGDNSLSPLVVLEKLSEEVVRCSQESSIVLSPEKHLSLSTRSPLKSLKPHKNRCPSLNVSLCQCVDIPCGMNSSLSKEPSPSNVEKELGEASSQYSVRETKPNKQPSSSDQEMAAQYIRNPEPKLLETQEEVDFSGSHRSAMVNLQPALSAVKEWRSGEVQTSERACIRNEFPGSAPLHPSRPHALRGSLADGDGLVHYFWGIPFCPSGQDPDQYTSVILCQLETYEKCLKQAQSQLLRKLEFGPPVLPAPMPRETQCLRRGQLAQAESIAMLNHHHESDEENEEVMVARTPPGQSSDGEESTAEPLRGSNGVERSSEHENSQQQSLDVFVEETQEEAERRNSDGDESEDSRDTGSFASVDVQPVEDVLFVCAETQQISSEDMQPESKVPQGSDVVSAQEPEDVVLIEDDAEELRPVTTSKKACVECPLCGQRFPLEKIEVHAADCNGASDGEGKWQVRTRSKPRRAGKQNGTDGSNLSLFQQ